MIEGNHKIFIPEKDEMAVDELQQMQQELRNSQRPNSLDRNM